MVVAQNKNVIAQRIFSTRDNQILAMLIARTSKRLLQPLDQ